MSDSGCYQCGEALDPDRTGRLETCGKCHAHVRVCYNCRFYGRAAANECAEPAAEPVHRKDKPNNCDFFRLSGGKASSGISEAAAREQLKNLFKNF
ncbi:MAG: hypothetical protein HYT87_11100 [Nitrospirae bacterium]|nr:hypothetical protein [Nitrospirota bacterium]